MRFLTALSAFLFCAAALPSAALAQRAPAEEVKPDPIKVDEVAAMDAARAALGRATPPATTDKENLWLLDLSSGGRVTIWLRPDVAPRHVERIKELTRRKFYDGLLFHRVIEGFMAQGGDPKGDGTGESDLPDLTAEFNYLPHVRGAVSAAREGAPENATPEQETSANNSANSQFFIMLFPRLSLDGKYTVFGRVLDGMQYVDAIERGEPPLNPTRILHAWIAADDPPAYVAPAPAAPVVDEPRVTLPGATPPRQ